jgi:S1-C subfamily serine protease
VFTNRRSLLCSVALLASLLASCGGGGGSATLGASGCKKDKDQTVAKAILTCTEKSIVYVNNPFGSGTGVVVRERGKTYVLTNEHVIDPFSSADVRIAGKEHKAVPVFGVNVAADIALVGPLTGVTVPTLPIGDGRQLERGDDVFLIGFPGESRSDAAGGTDSAITKGIVSKVRKVKEFGQTYVQTDAKIGDGQSGGPLFDGTGTVVGISGLSYADNAFALALSGADVKKAVGEILKGADDSYTGLPISFETAKGATSGTLSFHDASDTQTLYLAPAATDRTLTFSVTSTAKTVVDMTSVEEDNDLALSTEVAAIQRELVTRIATAQGGDATKVPDLGSTGIDAKLKAREPSPGRFVVPIKAKSPVEISIDVPLADAAASVAWTSDLPLVTASAPVKEKSFAVGAKDDHVYTTYEAAFDYLVPLTAGQEVELFARTPQADADIDVFEPDTKLNAVNFALLSSGSPVTGIETFTDTDDGLYGLDARGRFKATKTGVYRIRVSAGDSAVLGRFSVSDCAKVSCAGAAEPDKPQNKG